MHSHSEDTLTGLSDGGLGEYDTLGEIAQAMHVASGDLNETLDAIAGAAVSAISEADDAGLILIRKGQIEPVSATGQRPIKLDALQQKTKEGPCVDAANTQKIILVEDLSRAPSWPTLHEAAVDLGVTSMACVPLRVGNRTTGALSLYSAQQGAFEEADLAYVELFATLAALALADAQRADQLRTALASRDVLGQAKGILMERLRLSADQAFAKLSNASQTTNTKVTTVAEHLVNTGELLEPGHRAR